MELSIYLPFITALTISFYIVFYYSSFVERSVISPTILCNNSCQETLCLPYSVGKRWQLRAEAVAYQLTVCIIPKDLSTILMGLMCYLHDSDQFMAENRSIIREKWEFRGCKTKNEKYDKINRNILMDKSWKHVIIVREPLERFLSAWMDKCYYKMEAYLYTGYCYNCLRNLSCFVERFRQKLSKDRAKITSRDFIIENHFWPQTWYCNLFEDIHNYEIIKYDPNEREVFYKKISAILKESKVPKEKIEFINTQGMSGLTVNTVSNRNSAGKFKKKLYKNERLMKQLLPIFYNDYRLLGYRMPCI